MVTANPRIDPSTAPVAELTNYIVTTHHGYMREALPRIAGLLAACPAWDGLNPVFTAMRDELELHMRKEEAVLFPFIDRVERADRKSVV